ncbi:MAG TPA: beta-ketoacyl-ACP synthase II [Candidatus Dormibacteraeota bacterium]|nr:beta-ketoacyl-ACP synthase II [Candidatus Dormibacteraeota bacterium]
MTADGRKRVAITGLGFMTPMGADSETVWSNLVEGLSPVGPITQFDATNYATRIAAEVKDFVPEDFMDGKSARNASRYCQFGLAAARMALADAEFDPTTESPYDTSVVIGSVYGGIREAEAAHVTLREGAGWERISPFAPPMIGPNMAAAFVAMHVRAGGLNFSVNTACASGSNAVGEAAEVIRRGDAKVVLAGGAEACITPLLIGLYNRIHATSVRNDEPERACRPWDLDRDGFVFSEGSVMLVLEDWEHAVSRGARIRAELGGYGGSIDMRSFVNPDPEGVGAAQSMRMAVAKSGLEPGEVDYVNAHGTGTRVGDLAETKAIKRLFGDHAYELAVSSTKSVHGHLIGAAGAMEAAVCVLAIEKATVPPTINLDRQDPDCDLDYVPHEPRHRDIEVAISNSFGFGGHNATLLIRKARENGSRATKIA